MYHVIPIFLAHEILTKWPWDPLLALGVIVVVGLAPLVVVIGSRQQQKRTERLREEFGPDYDIVVNEHGDWRKAEKALEERLLERSRTMRHDQ